MESGDDSQRQRGNADQFVSTHWSLVLTAGNQHCEESRRALEQLCRIYWPPLYAYARRRVSSVQEAQDRTQAFFERLLEKQFLGDADPSRGRFRGFLITAFRRFLAHERDKATAQKRGGDRAEFSVDFNAAESGWGPVDTLTAERVYERQWALTLLQRVMQRLQREMERSGKAHQFQLLKEFLAGAEGEGYSVIAPQLGLSEAAARMAVSRMRGRYRELLREEIAQTVASPADIDDEVRQLFATFSD